jgi:hypothetical protein
MTEHLRAPIVAALAAIVAALLLMPTHLNAQSCEAQCDSDSCVLFCEDDPVFCGEGNHYANWTGGYEGTASYGAGAHSGAEPCYLGSCELQHPPCSGGNGPDGTGDLTLASLLDELESLRDSGDSERILMLAREHPEAIYLHAERGAVQVRDCARRTVAHLALPDGIGLPVGD